MGDTQGHQWRAILRSENGLLQEAPQGLKSTVIAGLVHGVLQHGPRYRCMHRELTDKTYWALVRSLLLVREDFTLPESEARLSAIWDASHGQN